MVPSSRSYADLRTLYWFREVPNLGDLLSPVIVGHYFGREFEWCDPAERGKVLAIGSIIEHVMPGDVVWGTGSKFPKTMRSGFARILAVRGPRTLEVIGKLEHQIPFGDPAVLLPNIFDGALAKKYPRKRLGLIPHYVDREKLAGLEGDGHLIDVTNTNWQDTVSKILSCDFVVSSSLHGIIVAEAYGVPAVWVQPSNLIYGGHHKFLDYYESTSRTGVCRDLEADLEAMERFVEPPPNFARMRDDLVDCLRPVQTRLS